MNEGSGMQPGTDKAARRLGVLLGLLVLVVCLAIAVGAVVAVLKLLWWVIFL